MTNGDASRFMALFGAYMDPAYNLARWLTRNDAAAQDVVQDSYLRAFAAMARFDGRNPKAWLFTIVRNCSYSWLTKNAGEKFEPVQDDEFILPELVDHKTPENFLIRAEEAGLLQKALDELPAIFREVVILKDIEELAYKEIAHIAGVPIGTVMSRLARGRALLRSELEKMVAV